MSHGLWIYILVSLYFALIGFAALLELRRINTRLDNIESSVNYQMTVIHQLLKERL